MERYLYFALDMQRKHGASRKAHSVLDLRKKIEERIDALPQLRLNLLPRALQNMHGDTSRIAVFQLDRSVVYRLNFIGGQKP
jgi:hypothetical protein